MPENQRVRLTKKMLKDSLIRLLFKESIHKLSVTQICEDAQINRTTFYKYYGSQYELLEEMESDVLAQLTTHLNLLDLDAEDSSFDNTAQLVRTMSFINDNIDLCRLLLNNNVDPEFPEKLLLTLKNIPHLISHQLSGKYTDEEYAYIFDFMISGGFSFIRKWINKENRETPEEIAILLNNTLLKFLKV